MNDKIKLIIADTLKREDIFRDLLRERSGLIDIEVLPLTVYLDSGYQPDKTLDKIHSYQTLQTHKHNFRVLAKAMTYPSFTDEVLSFIYNINEYGISIDQLPEKTTLEKEIKAVSRLFFDSLQTHQSQKDKINKLSTCDGVLFYPTYFKNIVQKENYDLLCQKGIKDYPLSQSRPTDIQLYRALNKRQEIESVAQYLIKQDLPLNDTLIVLANPSDYHYWLKAIFDRYQIPYATTITDDVLRLIQRYQKLVDLIKEPTTDKLIDCLNNRCFTDYFPQLTTYLKQFAIPFSECLYDLNNQTFLDGQTIITGGELYQMRKLKEAAVNQITELLPLLNKINDCDRTLFSIATLAYDIIKTQHRDKQEKDQLYLLKDFLETYLTKIDDLQLFDHLLANLKLDHRLTSTDQLLVISLDEAVGLKRKQMILLGADSVAYPKISYHTGIMDENYHSKLPYPTKDKRYRFTIEQLENCFNYCDHLIISYAYGDFAGKIKKISFELEEYIKRYSKVKFQEWPLVENDDLPYLIHKLDPKLSKKLFFEGSTLTGSVSSFERYFNCPYQYFVQSGLKVPSYDLSINSAKLGIILHFVMQSLIASYHQDYTNTADADIQLIIDQAFDQLVKIYPYHFDLIQLLKLNFTDLIKRYLKTLKKIEENEEFTPMTTEHRFQEEIDLGDTIIKLNGIIDRIDTTKDTYRIIDYKSSDHKLELKKVQNGQQLQLLTYVWLIEETLALQPEGAYYYSFNTKLTKVLPMKLNRAKHELAEYDHTDWYQNYLKVHQLSGWHFIPKDDSDKKAKDIEAIKTSLKANYKQLATELLNGVIAPDPKKDACKYCDFLGICRYYQKTMDELESDGDDDDLE